MSKHNKQKLVTVVTTSYIEQLVPDLLKNSFESYRNKDFSKRHFQVSVHENTNATSGIVLSMLALEGYRNRIYYLNKENISKKNLVSDISNLFIRKDPNFPSQMFTEILTEMIIVRDVVVHNHLYEVEIVNDGDWNMLKHRQKLLKDYGDSKRLASGLVIERTRRTKNLKLNVQPGKIGFEDLLTVLIVFDLFVGLMDKFYSYGYVPLHFTYKLNGEWIDNLSDFLSYFYVQLPNDQRDRIKKIYSTLSKDFIRYIPEYKDYFLRVLCPKCNDFGFHQPFSIYNCVNCGFEVKPIHHV